MKSFQLCARLSCTAPSPASSPGIKKAKRPPRATPADEIARLDTEMQGAYAQNADVLAPKEFENARENLKEAKDDLSDGDGQAEVLEDVGIAQAWLNRALEKVETRKAKIPAILDARQKALDAGARQFPPTQRELAKIDDDVRDNAEKLEKIRAEDSAKLQARYLDLELNAIKNTQLGGARGKVQAAIDKKAGDYAPKALKRAETDIKVADNLIVANRNGTESYSEAVNKANQSAEMLALTLAATKSGDVEENTAAQLVAQKMRIQKLEGQLGTAGETVASQGEKLKKAAQVMSLQESLETARREFTNDEAEVFQQGDRLLIRLKAMSFPSGRAELPAEALPVLAKVKDVAASLGPKQVRVEGHTDSTGSAQVNKSLSQARAEAIAEYLETNGIAEEKLQTVGYGFQKPIASNKSKDGRAQNRRVDVIITPEPKQSM